MAPISTVPIQPITGQSAFWLKVRIDGDELILKDLIIYPAETGGNVPVGVRQMLGIFHEIEQEARIQGFRRCTVEAHRLSGAAPGA